MEKITRSPRIQAVRDAIVHDLISLVKTMGGKCQVYKKVTLESYIDFHDVFVEITEFNVTNDKKTDHLVIHGNQFEAETGCCDKNDVTFTPDAFSTDSLDHLLESLK
jgi:hypothetical protein